MPALIREKQPSKFPVNDLFTHAHQFVRVEGEIGRILIRTAIDGIFRWQVMPLLAGHLTASAGRAQGGID
jgi:hypothetical protein